MSKEAKKSSIIKDAMVLFIITLIAGVSLGFVYELTLPAIEAQKLQAKTEAYAAVYADAAEFAEDESLTLMAAEAADKILIPNGLKGITIDEAFVALDGSGNKIGYVMSVTTQNGYGGAISVSLGYSVDGKVTGMEILTINETAGMGMKAAEPEFKDQFGGKQTEQFELVKGGGASGDSQINAISGATITSSAVTDAVNSGLRFINEMAEAGNN